MVIRSPPTLEATLRIRRGGGKHLAVCLTCLKIMMILAFDTTLGACSAAISHEGRLLANAFMSMQRGHAEQLLPMIERVRHHAKISYRDLESIAVTIGPGTFTGVRTGLAAAQALAQVHDVPLIGVSTLELLARAAVPRNSDKSARIIAAIDARRGQLYMQAFDALGKAVTLPVIDAANPRIVPNPNHSGLIVGSGAEILQSVLPDWRIIRDICQPDASILATASKHWWDRASRQPPSPLYLRVPDAKLPTGKKALNLKLS